MKFSILVFALMLSPFTSDGDDKTTVPPKTEALPGIDLSPDTRLEIRKSYAESYSIKGFPDVIFSRNPSCDTACVKITLKTENGEFYTVMTFERGKPAPEPFHFTLSREDANLVVIHFYEVLFSGGDTFQFNLEELLVRVRAN